MQKSLKIVNPRDLAGKTEEEKEAINRHIRAACQRMTLALELPEVNYSWAD